MTWILSYNFRKTKMRALSQADQNEQEKEVAQTVQPPVLIEEGIGTAPKEKAEEMVGQSEATGSDWREGVHGKKSGQTGGTIYSAAGYVLDGYFEQIQRAVFVTLALRLVVGSAAALWFWRRYIKRKRSR